MDEIYKLNGPLNPKLAKKITLYLKEGKFKYQDMSLYKEKFKKTHELILRFFKENLSVNSVKSILKEYDIILSDEEIKNKINLINKVKSFEKLILFLENSFKKKIEIKDYFSLLYLLINYWLFNNGYSLMALNPTIIYNMKQMIKEETSFEFFKTSFIRFYNYSLKKNSFHEIIPLNKLKGKIMKQKEILNEQFGIKKLFIYGSYAKNKNNEFSDLDIYIETNKKNSTNNILSVRDFLINILKIKVDISVDKSFILDALLEVF